MFNHIMKYFLIFLISLTFAAPVYAAKTVNGSVPVVQPLQAVPVGVGPNFGKNIESSGENPGGSGSPTVAASNSEQNQNPENSGIPSQSRGPNIFILLVIVFIGAAALGWVWLRRK
jgi:hypothetical protein